MKHQCEVISKPDGIVLTTGGKLNGVLVTHLQEVLDAYNREAPERVKLKQVWLLVSSQ